ncbi:MAG: tetratricopeptide repeat protein [Thermosediminibacteraceae bacterium]|nr:tetratricopeptide repeat protein [Thermosediminibacteraceae bacterium]
MKKKEALYILSKAINRRLPSITYLYLSILFGANMYDAALDYVRRKLLQNPAFDLFCWGGLICYFKNDFNAALHYFEKAISLEEAAEIRYFLGQTYLELLEFDKAEENYAAVLDNPDLRVKAIYGLAFCKSSKSQYREALELLDRALHEAEGADYVKIQNKKGLCWMELGHLEEAKECFYDCLKRAPEDNNAKLNLALVLTKSGEYEKAVELYKSSLLRYPHDITTINNLALCLAASGHFDEALKYCDRGLEIDPLNGDLLINKGYCLYKKGNYKKAIECFREAEKFVKDDIEVKNNLALCFMAVDKYKEALELLEDVLQRERRNDILINKAYCLIKMGQYREAADCYKELETKMENKAEIYTMLGICFEKMGETEKAVEYYNKALIA